MMIGMYYLLAGDWLLSGNYALIIRQDFQLEIVSIYAVNIHAREIHKKEKGDLFQMLLNSILLGSLSACHPVGCCMGGYCS